MKKSTSIYERYIKRLLDIVLSLLALILFSWLYLLVALLVRVKLGSPVIFIQKRAGKIDPVTKKEKIFNLYKFRTMNNNIDDERNLLPDSKRLTSFGVFLRATSLDELPEILNILKGDMSFIGPRPLVTQYLPFYNELERNRHLVRPGLSGWAQVNGRNNLQWEDRFELDVEYINTISFINDLKIILLTIKKVVIRENVVTRGSGKTIDFDEYRSRQRRVISNDIER